MAKITIELEIECDADNDKCYDCCWVHGDIVGDPYCGLFERHALPKPLNTTLGKHGDKSSILDRLPECIAAGTPPKVDVYELAAILTEKHKETIYKSMENV